MVSRDEVELDVLVIGGGAQGLWLLNDLNKRNYRAVLLERGELGGGQTCHSHGLIHRGHYYDDTDMMIILNAAAQFWEAFVKDRGIKKLNQPNRALAGFGPVGGSMSRHENKWSSAGLNYKLTNKKNWPPVLSGGMVESLFETDEFSLDASEIVKGLTRYVDHAIYKLDRHHGALKFTHNGKTIESVKGSLSGHEVVFRPKFVILSAGIGNCELLANLGVKTNESPKDTLVQAQRNNHMMVLRGDELPMMTAVFPIAGGLQGVFLCSRKDPETDKTVWLVSDHNSKKFLMSRKTSSKPSEEWINRMLISLKAVAPMLFEEGFDKNLEASVYTGLTSERNFGEGKHMTDLYIDPFGFDNMLAIWPTKLTMTPFASNVALRFIRPKVPEPSGEWPKGNREVTDPRPEIACEMWAKKLVSGPYEHKTSWAPFAACVASWRADGELSS